MRPISALIRRIFQDEKDVGGQASPVCQCETVAADFRQFGGPSNLSFLSLAAVAHCP
jgi:hypothetical protein